MRHAAVLLALAVGAGAQTFSVDEAKWHFQVSKAVACEASAISAWDCLECTGLGVEKVYGVTVDDEESGQAFVIATSDRIVVAFRASDNVENWVNNLQVAWSDLTWTGLPEEVKVHSGFLDGYESLAENVLPWLEEAVADCPQCSIHVTGHSLGGAKATLCVTDLRLRGYAPELWTFGSPRVGNDHFAEWFNEFTEENSHVSWRVVHDRDIVPQVPFNSWGYYHIATEVWEVDGEFVVCDGSGEDEDCQDSVSFLLSSIPDHLIYLGIESGCDE